MQAQDLAVRSAVGLAAFLLIIVLLVLALRGLAMRAAAHQREAHPPTPVHEQTWVVTVDIGCEVAPEVVAESLQELHGYAVTACTGEFGTTPRNAGYFTYEVAFGDERSANAAIEALGREFDGVKQPVIATKAMTLMRPWQNPKSRKNI